MSEGSSTVFLLEDEREAGALLANFLQLNGYRVLFETRGTMGRERLLAHAAEVDACILDVMVPEVDGFELAGVIRRHPQLKTVPILFLTAKDREADEIEGLQHGGDAYLRKPCSLQVIKAHLERLLARHPKSVTAQPKRELIQAGPLVLDPEQRTARIHEQPLSLTHSEYEILLALARHPGQVYSRRQLLELIADDAEREVFERTVDAHIKNLRLKLGEAAPMIKTHRGLGYGLDLEAVDA